MPTLGEITKNKQYSKHIWVACEVCGKEHWVDLIRSQPDHTRCGSCASRANLLKGRKASPLGKNVRGYRAVKIYPNNPFFPMAWTDGHILEHRLVMAQNLGRCLKRWEIVHHKNHIKTDNHIDNLELFSDNGHKQITYLEERIKVLEKKVKELETLVRKG